MLLVVCFLFYQGMIVGSRIEINVTVHRPESNNEKVKDSSTTILYLFIITFRSVNSNINFDTRAYNHTLVE